jgi:hypothetical protein
MSIIEANITIDVEDGVDTSAIIAQIDALLSSVNNKPAQVNITDMDNPIHNNPINYRPGV